MDLPTITAGFQIETTDSGWGHIRHEECGKWTSFVNPTRERVHWYIDSHRCGPPDSEWHVSKSGATEAYRSESPGSTAAWMRSVSRYLDTRPPGLMTDPTVWPAIEELAHTLVERFPGAFGQQRPEQVTRRPGGGRGRGGPGR